MSITQKIANDPWVSIALKARTSELPLINQRLKIYGFDTAGQMFRAFVSGKFPILTEDKQIDNLYQNQQGSGLNTYTIGAGGKDFYQNVDMQDFYAYCLNIRKLSANSSRDTVSYLRDLESSSLRMRG